MAVYTKRTAETASLFKAGTSLMILGLLFGTSLVASPTFTTFDFPNASQTLVSGNNQRGLISGMYRDENGLHAYLRYPDGMFSTVTLPSGLVNSVSAPNLNNTITGSYSDAALVTHGFIYTGQNTVVTFDVPGASGTSPVSINDQGMITGKAIINSTGYGFVRQNDGTIVTFLASNMDTTPNSINNAGVVTGAYGTDQPKAFTRNVSGAITTINPPNATSGGSFGVASSTSGVVTGFYFVAGRHSVPVQIGFLYNPNDEFTQIIIPNAAVLYVTGISTSNSVIGYYTGDANTLGFIRGAQGNFQPCNVPGAIATYPTSVNTNGVVVGEWNDSSLVTHGFIFTL